MSNQLKKSDPVVDTLLTFFGGFLFVNHIRTYVKNYPDTKQKVIEALELLIQELKNNK